MLKVITYGTYDLLHRGHFQLLKRAKALGDYLIVGVTSDDFDKARGKINIKQSLLERIEGVRATGLADEIIVEEYEGQKIDDIKRYGVEIFTVGSDWIGKFDYLKVYCNVVYLPRTEGVSSSVLRAEKLSIRLGLAGESTVLRKFKHECGFVNGISVAGVYTKDETLKAELANEGIYVAKDYEDLLSCSDAVYICSHPSFHFYQVSSALLNGKHVLCESPIVQTEYELDELFRLADDQGLILMDAIKTAYSTAYYRLLLMLKSGCIGEIVSVDATCTSLSGSRHGETSGNLPWNSICAWGPVAMLPLFQLLGTDYVNKSISSCLSNELTKFDIFTKIDFLYPHAVGSIKVGKGVKSEGELVISGTKGYIYVPAPWWKTDYFEIRYENQSENRRCFYPLEGEGIRYQLVSFIKAIGTGTPSIYIERTITQAISQVIEDFNAGKNLRVIKMRKLNQGYR